MRLAGLLGLHDPKAVPVVWLSLHQPEIKPRAYWDQGWLEHLLNGWLWPSVALPPFEHHVGSSVPDCDGAVVVLPARWHADDTETLNRLLAPLSWVLLVLCGDEENALDRSRLRHPNMRVWVQTPALLAPGERGVGDLWPPDCPDLLSGMTPMDRPLAWAFAGQINTDTRRACGRALNARQTAQRDGEIHTTRVFGSGLPYVEYLQLLTRAKVAPCPSGPCTPDTFRLFEALEAGCLPVVDEGDQPGYFTRLFGEQPPFQVVTDWERDWPAVLDRELAGWPANANRAFGWWMAQKRVLALAFAADLWELTGAEPHSKPEDGISVLLPTSPIPSHPSTAVIEETVVSVRERLPNAEIILMVDGVRPEQEHRRGDYEEFLRRVLWLANHRWHNVLPMVHDEHLHQAAMTRLALEQVRTPLVLFVEHDTPLVGAIPFAGLAGAIQSGAVNVVRLHHEANVLEPHRHLMLDQAPQPVAGVPLLRTVQWSQRPHLASTDFYRGMLAEFFGSGARTMIEDTMHGVVDVHWHEHGRKGWDRFKLWMYAPDGDMKRSTHTDGRAGEAKYPMHWSYDGPTPLGAPFPDRDEDRIKIRDTPSRPDAIRVGVYGARGDRRGLAIQLTAIAKHLQPAKVLGVDMGDLSPYPNSWNDYDPDTLTVLHHDDLRPDAVRPWLEGLDVIVAAETFYSPWMTALCREQGVATVLQVNPEFLAHVLAWLPLPDLLVNPTTWRLDTVPGGRVLPVGVDRERFSFRLRTKVDSFLHVVGHPAAHDRQGTRVLWEALRYVKEPTRVIVRSQQPLGLSHQYGSHVEVDLRTGDVADNADLYRDGSVLVHPRRYGGLSLPAQEALSTGMPVLMPQAPPQDGWLPPGMLLACGASRSFNSLVGPLPLYETDAMRLAVRMDELSANPAQVEALSLEADRLAGELAWPNLVPRYREAFEVAMGARVLA